MRMGGFVLCCTRGLRALNLRPALDDDLLEHPEGGAGGLGELGLWAGANRQANQQHTGGVRRVIRSAGNLWLGHRL